MTSRRGGSSSDEEILDFSEVRPFEPLDSRVSYLVRVSNLERGTAASSGQRKTSCEMTILAPEEVTVEHWEPDHEAEGGMKFVEHTDRTTRAKGRKLFREFSHQPQALPFLHQFLKAVDPDVELNEAFRYDPSNYLGLDLTVRIKNEAFEEQIRPRVGTMSPKDRFKGEVPSDDA